MWEPKVDIDSFVDYRAEYSQYVKKAHVSGDNLVGLCPFHDDKNNSFSVDLKTGKWHCLTEDTGGNFISFYARIHNVDNSEAFKQILDKYNVPLPKKKPDKDKKEKPALCSYSLMEYALEKRLPKEWLATECHLTTERDRYYKVDFLKVPYLDENGKELTFRKRFANKEFRWKRLPREQKNEIRLYGEWKLEAVRETGYVVLVEGESDSQSLWYMGISALGVPGASMFKEASCGTLQDLKVYIHKEKDRGGETFFDKVTQTLKKGDFIGRVFCFTCGDIPDCKDPSDVFIKFGKGEGAKTIFGLLKKAEEIDLDAPGPVASAIGDAPVALRQPQWWEYSEDGITRYNDKGVHKLICRTPLLLTKRLKSLDTGDEKIEVAFKRDGKWHSAIFARSTIFTSRGVTALADMGCTVTSENAKQIVQFLSALEAENLDVIPRADAASMFGWHAGGRFIPGLEGGIILDVEQSQRAMAEALVKNGDLNGWIATMRPHRERDKFRFILAASFAAPLLKIIKQRTFFVYNWGDSKAGKTAALKAALSAWGDPERLMVNFNATQVGIERTAALYCDLPLGIDERQLAGRDQAKVWNTIYMISEGKGKVRGARAGGVQHTHTWRTVAIGTGEEPITTDTAMTGISTRTLELYGGPFEDEKSASAMHQDSVLNCGWAGPEYIKRLVTYTEESICEWYDRMKAHVEGLTDGKSGSHVAAVAAVALADALIDDWFFSGQRQQDEAGDKKALKIRQGSWERAMGMAETVIREEMESGAKDINERAVQFLVDWVASNKLSFGENAVGVCLGLMSEPEGAAYIFPAILRDALERAGYPASKTLRYMAEKGLIDSRERKDHDGRNYQVSHRFDGRNHKFYKFFIEKCLEDDEEDAAGGDEGGADKDGQLTMDGFMKVPEDAELPFD